MPALIMQLIIVLLICGFGYWVYLKLVPVLAQFIAEPFLGLINVLVLIFVCAIVLFYAIIPLLQTLGRMKFIH